MNHRQSFHFAIRVLMGLLSVLFSCIFSILVAFLLIPQGPCIFPLLIYIPLILIGTVTGNFITMIVFDHFAKYFRSRSNAD